MRFNKLLDVIASSSYCKRRRVGAIIARDGRIISTGYNGTPMGMPNKCEDAENNTKSLVIHAEANAILFASKYGIATEGATLYVSVSPCIECAKMILQSGIKEVRYLKPYRNDVGLNALVVNGINCKELEDD